MFTLWRKELLIIPSWERKVKRENDELIYISCRKHFSNVQLAFWYISTPSHFIIHQSQVLFSVMFLSLGFRRVTVFGDLAVNKIKLANFL